MQRSVPVGACDCHMHIYDDRFPLVPQAVFKPPNAPVSDYLAMRNSLGLSRVVVVQPNGYGFDNRCTLQATVKLGSSARAIVVIHPDTADEELERLTRAGVRGVRHFLLPGGTLGWDTLEKMATRIANFGWHIQLQLDGRQLPEYEAALARLPARLVIDHNGKFLEPVATSHPGFISLRRLLQSGNTWVKLSAPYETSRIGPPRYDDVGAIATALVEANPERCLWASNWPHPGQARLPDNANLLKLLEEWAGDTATRDQILVANPAILYGF
ncbi:MAG: amidohydrolase family protein [Casimicrobiaceae bacterium]